MVTAWCCITHANHPSSYIISLHLPHIIHLSLRPSSSVRCLQILQLHNVCAVFFVENASLGWKSRTFWAIVWPLLWPIPVRFLAFSPFRSTRIMWIFAFKSETVWKWYDTVTGGLGYWSLGVPGGQVGESVRGLDSGCWNFRVQNAQIVWTEFCLHSQWTQ